MKKNILVIAPHHDDEVIGCGGTLLKFKQRQYKITVVYITAGYSGIPLLGKEKAIETREKEARKSSQILGITNTIFLKEKDRELNFNFHTTSKLIKIMRMTRPLYIFAPHPNESDREHRIVSEITNEAIWLANSRYFPQLGKHKSWTYNAILYYEVHTPIQRPQLYVDISDYIDLKTKALNAYKSQIKNTNYSYAISSLNRYRGIMSSSGGYVEAFEVKRFKEKLLFQVDE